MTRLIVTCCFLATLRISHSQNVSVQLIKTDSYFEINNTLTFSKSTTLFQNSITVDESQVFQKVDGLGFTLSDSSAWNLFKKLEKPRRLELLRTLFQDIKFNLVRIYIGTSAFAITNYTYDDTCCDLSDFSIEYDRSYIIPILRAAIRYNSNLKVFAISQSPPAWMKSSESLIGGYLKAEYFKTFAEYLSLFVSEYEKEGVPIYAVLIQDEPQYLSNHPCMRMSAQTQSYLLRTKVSPLFASNGFKTKLLVSSQNWDILENYGLQILKNPKTLDAVSGIGFTCYNGNAGNQDSIYRDYNKKELWLIECSDETWAGKEETKLLMERLLQREIMGSLKHGARGIMKYNLALDENFGPTNGGCTNCLGLLTIFGNGSYVPTSAFRMYRLFGQGFTPGTKRIAVEAAVSTPLEILQYIGFRGPRKDYFIYVYNPSSGNIEVHIHWNESCISYTLESNGIARFAWKAN